MLRRCTRWAGFGVLGFVVLLVVGFVIAYVLTPIPSTAQADATAQGPVFYYNDGKTEIARKGVERTPVTIDKVPPHVQDAVIAAENRSFRSDPGVSIRGTGRAMWSAVSGGGATQGGSTITQQMVRNYYSGLSQERTVSRKLKEVMVALKVGRKKDKDWILEHYLNTIYFGRDAYGIEAASQAYYRKPVGQLTEAEGAYLAAAIQKPNYYANPVKEVRPYAEARWRYVIDGMVKMGRLDQQRAAALTFPKPKKKKHAQTYAGQNGYMMAIAEHDLLQRGYTKDEILRGGLKITTTFDKPMMEAAKATVEKYSDTFRAAKGSKKIRTGLVAIDPESGEVMAFYGGKEYLDQQLDNSFDSPVQTGSGFKAYALAAALENGKKLNTILDGGSPRMFDGAQIKNDSGRSFGSVNLVTATKQSINTAYVQLGEEVGLDEVALMAEKAGIPEKRIKPHENAVTLPLGVADATVAEQAGGFATFAAEGEYRKPHTVRAVKRPGKKAERIEEDPTRAFTKETARDATYAMTQVVQGGTGSRARLPDGRPVAGKTGTTSAGRQIWFNGFIPQMSASVAVFRGDNKPLVIPGYETYGGQLPAQIWRDFTTQAIQLKQGKWPIEQFGRPSTYTGSVQQPGTHSPRPRPTVSPTLPTTSPRPTTPGPTVPTGSPTGSGAPRDKSRAEYDGDRYGREP